MKNHSNILPKLASFDLKWSKMRWRLGLRPRPRWGSLRCSLRPPSRKRQRAFGARHSLFRVHFYISNPLPGPSLTEFLDPPLLSRFYSCTTTRPPSSPTATVAPRCLPGLTFPDFDLAPKRNKKFGYCGLDLV